MSDLILSLIDERIQKLTLEEANIATERGNLQRERDRLVKLATKSDVAPAAKASKPKATARKHGGPSVKEQILAFMRLEDAPVRIAQIVEATGAKSTTVNGTLHQLKKAGQVSLTVEGWTIAAPATNHNGGAEARV